MKNKKLWRLAACVVAGVLFVIYFKNILHGLGLLWSAAMPLMLGGCLAFLINLIMAPLEAWLSGHGPKFVKSHARAFSLLLSILAFFAIIFLICLLVFPQLVESIQLLIRTIPTYAKELQDAVSNLFRKHPQIATSIDSLNINWNDVFSQITSFLKTGLTTSIGSVVTLVSGVISISVNSIIMLIFAIYILSDKERFIDLYHRMCRVYLSKEHTAALTHVLETFNQSFKSFVSGQCIDALILGTACIVGMWILRLPYAPMIGTLVGVTNIIPMIGAFIGGGIGWFLVFTVSPMKSIVFLVFLCVIQQIESNAIYPRIVGNSVGLPGIYVTIVIVICGALAGIAGMVLGIPAAAAIYRLAREHFERKERAAGIEPDKSDSV